ncbi:Gag protein [Phytophthora palmivora]|uniref:Gag protein n=1 Tax=Phytophthora palmivora TaxID=4796 RepID=A0A2P4WXH1_9STRA|nr:Gag protein [Phytophthora palmivora]
MDSGEFPHLTDSKFESARKMASNFGGNALRSLAAATPVEPVERIEAFDTYERGLIAHVQGLQVPVDELKPAQPKPLMLKINPYEGKEGKNLHFWVREIGLAMDAALISTERLRVAFALSNLGENPLPEHIKVTVFMDGQKVGPSHTQLFRVHANTMEEAIQIALQEEYSHRQARTPTVPVVRMDLAVKFEDFDSAESFLVLDMDKYDLILGMPALVSNVPTSVRDWGARDGHQGAYAPEEVLGVTDANEGVAQAPTMRVVEPYGLRL